MDARHVPEVVRSERGATRHPQQSPPVPSPPSDSIPTAQFIQDLVDGKQYSDSKLFEQLERAHGEQEAHGLYMKKVVIHTGYEHMAYQREAAVCHRNMSNKFFVPIWAAAKKEDEAYIMYPRLIPLTEILPSLKIEVSDSKKEKRLMETLRRCFAPIALGLDALHTLVLNSRAMYYHRDLSIKKIYMCQSDIGKSSVYYGDAMLKISKFTRGTQEEMIDIETSLRKKHFLRKYFHHPEPWESTDDKVYQKKHDWFSFGVYIVDVLVNVLPVSDELRNKLIPEGGILHLPMSNDVWDYRNFVSQIGECVGDVVWNERTSVPLLEQYLATAKTCMSMMTEDDKEISSIERVIHYEFPRSLKNRFPDEHGIRFEPYNFEYELTSWTADLLWTYDDSRTDTSKKFVLSRPKGRKSIKKKTREKERPVCQACLLRPSVKIPTRNYRRSISSSTGKKVNHFKHVKCDESCNTFYCVSCYTNGERLFCPRKHGTTSSVIGHHSSFALIMYGDEENDLFMNDSNNLSNVLKHRLICGIPEPNVVQVALFDKKQPVRGPEEILQAACDRMRRKIHNRKLVGTEYKDMATCVNDAQYSLFIFYSGHGVEEGDWCVSKSTDSEGNGVSVLLKKEIVDHHLMSITRCTNKKNPTCDAFCIEVTYLADHCYPVKSKLRVVDGIDGVSSTLITPMVGEMTHYNAKQNSEITHWFCNLLACAEFCEQADKRKCEVCAEFKAHIAKKCFNAFIDAKGVEIFAQHVRLPKYDSSPPRVVVELHDTSKGKSFVFAHFHHKGILLNVTPYREGPDLKPIPIKFDINITCEEIKKSISAQLKESHFKYVSKDIYICLLADLPTDYYQFSLVCDLSIRETLNSNLLYYHVFTQCCKVVLTAIDGGRAIEDVLDNLDIDVEDIPHLVTECKKEALNTRHQPCLLPNLLVHVVHHLRQVVYKETAQDLTNSVPTDTAVQESRVLQPTSPHDESDTERVRNSFVGLLFSPARNGQIVREYSSKEWECLKDHVNQYTREGRARVFDIEQSDINEIRIKWSMSPSPVGLNADVEPVSAAVGAEPSFPNNQLLPVSRPVRESTYDGDDEDIEDDEGLNEDAENLPVTTG